MTNNFFKIYKLLEDYETKENIEKLNSQYGNLWPMFKITIFASYLRKNDIQSRSYFRRVLGVCKRAIIPFKDLKNFKHPQKKIYLKYEEMWISGSRRRIDGYNKFIDPYFIEFANDKSIILEKTKNEDLFYEHKYIANNKILNSESSYNWFNLTRFYKNIFNYKKIVDSLQLKELVEKYPVTSSYNLFIDYTEFVNSYNFYCYYFSKFKNLKRIYYVGNGVPGIFGLNAAAHFSNIESIELQHGVISSNGIDYKYKYSTTELYKLAPSKILVYSKEAKEILERNTKNNIKIEQIKNYAFEEWKKNNEISTQKNNILITLQNIVFSEDCFLYKFLKYINNKYPKLNIVFKLHPTHQYVKEKYDIILENKGINYKWDNKKEINESLASSILNITAFSTTVEDALYHNVSSWIITKEGALFYEYHILKNSKIKSILNIEDAIFDFETNIKPLINE